MVTTVKSPRCPFCCRFPHRVECLQFSSNLCFSIYSLLEIVTAVIFHTLQSFGLVLLDTFLDANLPQEIFQCGTIRDRGRGVHAMICSTWDLQYYYTLTLIRKCETFQGLQLAECFFDRNDSAWIQIHDQ